MLSLVVLVVVGAGAAVASSDGPAGAGDAGFWLRVAVKIAFLAALLCVVSLFRRYAARVAFRQLYHLPAGGARTVQARGRLTLVFGMEVAVAFAVMITTGLLMMVAQAS